MAFFDLLEWQLAESERITPSTDVWHAARAYRKSWPLETHSVRVVNNIRNITQTCHWTHLQRNQSWSQYLLSHYISKEWQKYKSTQEEHQKNNNINNNNNSPLWTLSECSYWLFLQPYIKLPLWFCCDPPELRGSKLKRAVPLVWAEWVQLFTALRRDEQDSLLLEVSKWVKYISFLLKTFLLLTLNILVH